MRFFNKKWARITVALFLCAAISIGFMLSQSRVFRGSRGVKPGPDLQKWFDSVTDGDDNSVSIDLGDRAGGGGSEDDAKLCVTFLSIALNKWPKAKTFTINWCYVVAMGVDSSTLVYDKQSNTISEYYEGRGKPFGPSGSPIVGVTDSMVHSAAEHNDSYYNIKKYS